MQLQRSKKRNPPAAPVKAEKLGAATPAFRKGDRVQYVGDLAYKGMSGEVVGLRPDGQPVVRLDGIPAPVNVPPSDLVLAGSEFDADPNALVTSKHPRARYVVNTSGGLLIIPDLVSDSEEGGIALDPGEKVDLLQMFTPEQINRSRGVTRALATVSETTGLKQLTVINSLDDPVPDGAIVVPLAQRVEPETVLQAPVNIFDQKLDEDYQKEQERNDRLKAASRRERHTSQHGRASRTLGR